MGQSFSGKVIESTFKGFPIDSYGKTLAAFLATKPNLYHRKLSISNDGN